MTKHLQPASVAYILGLLCAAGGMLVFGDGYAWRIAALVGLYAAASIGFQLIFGRLGLLMLAQGALFGLGAYATAMITAHLGLDPWFGVAGAMNFLCFAGVIPDISARAPEPEPPAPAASRHHGARHHGARHGAPPPRRSG